MFSIAPPVDARPRRPDASWAPSRLSLVWLGGPYLALGLLCAVGVGGAYGAAAGLAGLAAALLLGLGLHGVASLALQLRRTRAELSHAAALLNELADRLAHFEETAQDDAARSAPRERPFPSP